MQIRLRPMNQDDIEAAFALTRQMKWPHRREDWRQALDLGEGLVAERDGAAIGTGLCWRWGPAHSTLGLLIVDGAAQGNGVGGQLMASLMQRLAGSAIQLHATVAGKGLYQRLGFVSAGELGQHQCRTLGAATPAPPQDGDTLSPAGPGDADLLTALDTGAHGMVRPSLIADLLARGEKNLLLRRRGAPRGFACLRRFGHGYAIGPVIALDLHDAIVLVDRLLADLAGHFVRIDTPASLGLGEWLTRRGLPVVDAPTIMIKGAPWQLLAGGMRPFGLMTQAMG
ncbi:GNAT family N-acetyltransferase [Acerihabitans arboris]|uniref:GNAT family N-acetyltransferase n=1 Tax=Acerihabitans arboris TaxID=2691583 RepID=A0A845SFR7_9GAMM|nr:GNAT family N-acetyltransferase [Acerihabitans arboris]NDL62232.1 GNAT family N-acetyltransferase [Acerihabitans arboris]